MRELCEAMVARGGVNVIVTNRKHMTSSQLLVGHKLDHLFVEIAGNGDPYPPKPDPAAFLAMIAKYNLDPQETLTIGDREKDILAGKAAGVKTCLFGDEKIRSEPDFRIASFAEIYKYL